MDQFKFLSNCDSLKDRQHKFNQLMKFIQINLRDIEVCKYLILNHNLINKHRIEKHLMFQQNGSVDIQMSRVYIYHLRNKNHFLDYKLLLVHIYLKQYLNYNQYHIQCIIDLMLEKPSILHTHYNIICNNHQFFNQQYLLLNNHKV